MKIITGEELNQLLAQRPNLRNNYRRKLSQLKPSQAVLIKDNEWKNKKLDATKIYNFAKRNGFKFSVRRVKNGFAVLRTTS